MLVALLLASFVTCSLAQPECDAANQTLYMDSDCLAALNVVIAGANSNGSTNESAVMMVCGASTTCNQNIRAALENCPVSFTDVVRYINKDINGGVAVAGSILDFRCHCITERC